MFYLVLKIYLHIKENYFCKASPPILPSAICFLKKFLSVFNEKDGETLNIHEKYLNCCSVCKRFQPTLPKPAVGNLFEPDKMKLNQVVTFDLKKYKNKWIIYLMLQDTIALTLLKISLRKLL